LSGDQKFSYSNLEEASGSYYVPQDPNPDASLPGGTFAYPQGLAGPIRSFVVTETNTVVQELTVKYFQRVYDDGTAGYCYYTKTSIDPTPSAGETTPNYTGTISDHSVVKILEIY
jgi:hypothetical protein